MFIKCLRKVTEYITNQSKQAISIAIPWRIGCGLAGGDWDTYRETIESWATELSTKTGKKITVNIYHLETNPPKGEMDEETEAIMARLTQRADDTEEALKQRLVNFAANRDAVAATFASVALTVDGNRDPETVWAEVDAYLSK